MGPLARRSVGSLWPQTKLSRTRAESNRNAPNGIRWSASENWRKSAESIWPNRSRFTSRARSAAASGKTRMGTSERPSISLLIGCRCSRRRRTGTGRNQRPRAPNLRRRPGLLMRQRNRRRRITPSKETNQLHSKTGIRKRVHFGEGFSPLSWLVAFPCSGRSSPFSSSLLRLFFCGAVGTESCGVRNGGAPPQLELHNDFRLRRHAGAMASRTGWTTSTVSQHNQPCAFCPSYRRPDHYFPERRFCPSSRWVLPRETIEFLNFSV